MKNENLMAAAAEMTAKKLGKKPEEVARLVAKYMKEHPKSFALLSAVAIKVAAQQLGKSPEEIFHQVDEYIRKSGGE
ncbi:MAG: hypothetical protein IJK81_00420 [Selenomonadaceae bacterium]|nr:hypothetical protein [Selenomonadaceae bacterium]